MTQSWVKRLGFFLIYAAIGLLWYGMSLAPLHSWVGLIIYIMCGLPAVMLTALMALCWGTFVINYCYKIVYTIVDKFIAWYIKLPK